MFIQTNHVQRLCVAFLQIAFRVVRVSAMSNKYHSFPESIAKYLNSINF
jgi:hypothetical protein